MAPKSDLRIENDFREPYFNSRYKETPETTQQFLTAVGPVLDQAVQTYSGGSQPVLRSRAKLIALEAAKGYDPSRGPLKPHLMSHLQRLQRMKTQLQQPLRVPERVSYDYTTLRATEDELENELNRPPSVQELADRMGISPKRIEYVRRFNPGITEGRLDQLTQNPDSDDGPLGVAVRSPASYHAKLNLLYDDLSPYDQALMDHTLGLHGAPRLSGGTLARKFNVSPSAISQRQARLQKMLDDLEGAGGLL